MRYLKSIGLAALVVTGLQGLADEYPGAALPPIRSGCEVDYPPFCIVQEDGRADGFSVELMRASLKAMGRDVTFRTGPWAEVRGWLEQGEVDALPLVGRTPEREALFDFTVPYLTMHGAIVVHKDTTDIHRLANLRGRRVGVMAGDNAEEFLRRQELGIELVATSTFADAFRALSRGQCDAVVIQRLVAIRLLEESGLTDLRIVDRPILEFSQDFCFAVKEGDRETLALLNEGLALSIADGTHRRLHSKWFAALELPRDRPILIGGDHDYPPFEFLDSGGRPTGFNVELTRAIAHEMGIEVRFRLGPWSEIVDALRQGEIDALQGMFYSDQRSREFDFSQPYLVAHYVGVVRQADGPAPAALDDLDGLDLVVQEDDRIHDYLRAKGLTGRLTLVGTQEEALRRLAEGMHDCALVARLTTLWLMEKRGWTHLAPGHRPFLEGEYGYAVPKGQTALLAQFSEGLAVVKASGEYRRIYEKWLGVYDPAPPTWRAILKAVAFVALPLLVMILLALVWSWCLRRKVAARTAELAARETQYRLLAENTMDVIWTMTMDFQFTYVNPAVEQQMGYRPEEFLGTRLPAHCDAAHFSEIKRIIEQHVARGPSQRGIIVETEVRHRDGSAVPVEIHGRVIFDQDGLPVLVQGTTRDIAERKRHEARIDHLNRVLRALRNVNQLITHETDRDALLRQACDILIETRGYRSAWVALRNDGGLMAAAESGIGGNFAALRADIDRGDWPTCCRSALAHDQVTVTHNPGVNCVECPLAHADRDAATLAGVLRHGRRVYGVLVVALPAGMADDEQEQTLFKELVGDVAYALYGIDQKQKRKQAENALLQAQKMESIGRLAGGIAHDFNNLLMGIMGYADLCRDRIAADHPIREWLDEITVEAKRSAGLTRQLLAFARKQTIAPQVLDLNEAVQGMLKMLRRLIGEHIRLVWAPKTNIWPVKMDPAQIDQILANLCVNARDAIGATGAVTIETENVTFDAAYCRAHEGFRPGEFARLAVSDDGCGMDRETLRHVFEPFFTTKKVGEGTGLGLATVYGIVKQNNGFVNIYSEPGGGTTIRVYLPRVDEATTKRPTDDPEAPGSRGGNETILLVEDEKSIRVTTRHFLERLGYDVLEAEAPEAALRLTAEHREGIDLLLTDVVMPGMSGRELAEKLAIDLPSMKVLYISGYTANVIEHRGILEEGVQFMSKPIGRDELARKVRAVLDGEGTA